MWRKVYALVLPVWVLVWVFRWSDLENFLWQVLHWKGFTPGERKKNLFLEPNTFWEAEWHQLFLNFQKSGFLWSCSETCRVPRRVHSCFSSQAGGHGHHHLLFCDFKKSSCLACSSRPPRTPEVLKWAVLIFQTNIKHKKMLMNLEWTHK